jgi:two-component system, response regulator PdtaR
MIALDIVAEDFEAIAAHNADEAIRILENRSDIEIVFTDINMPGSMDGLNLTHAVRTRWPFIQFIVTSGRVNNHPLPQGSVFLPKPYDSAQLSDALRKLAA